jgi:hypothetical protein
MNVDMRTRLRDRFTVLLTIDAKQVEHPGYCSDIAAAIINGELEMLASESSRYWARQLAEVCFYGHAASGDTRV